MDVFIDICKDGVVTYRTRRTQPRRQNAALPFYIANSESHARFLIITLCKRQYNGDYRLHDFTGELDDIDRVVALFSKHDTLGGRPL